MIKKRVMTTWIRKCDGCKYYSLPPCSICGRESSTSDKETALAWREGRICRSCTKTISQKQIDVGIDEAIKEVEQRTSWFARLKRYIFRN